MQDVKPSAAVPLYNLEYESSKLDQETEKDKLSGEWFRLHHGATVIGFYKGDGVYIKSRVSNKQIEEDLATMYGKGTESDTYLTLEEQGAAVNAGFRSVLKDFVRFLNPNDLKQMFPGFTNEDIDTYDISSAKVKVFVIENGMFDLVYENVTGRKNGEHPFGTVLGSYIPAADQKTSLRYTNPNINSLLTTSSIMPDDDIDIILVREGVYSRLDRAGRLKDEAGSPRDVDVYVKSAQREVAKIVRHELIHSLHLGATFDFDLREGITRYYERHFGENARSMTGIGGMEAERDIDPAPALVGNIIRLCTMHGMDIETVHRALISSDAHACKQVYATLVSVMGSSFADQFMKYGFLSIAAAEEETFTKLVELNKQRKSGAWAVV